MTSRELLRLLRRQGAVIEPSRGKGGHVRVELNGRITHLPTGSGEMKRGLLHGILRQLGVRLEDLQR